ncbi:hypothetical protein, partial [Nocardia farcinica]|uniref:hypothetical protein n=1 Tax=Nocardia farcinica TaxID=37329 RepID=UPI0034DB115D
MVEIEAVGVGAFRNTARMQHQRAMAVIQRRHTGRTVRRAHIASNRLSPYLVHSTGLHRAVGRYPGACREPTPAWRHTATLGNPDIRP